MTFYSFGPHIPEIEADTFIAPGSFIIGKVYISEGASIWYRCVLRGDVSRIKVGRNTNIQDGCILHGAALPIQLDVEVGDYVNIGHKAIIHGCKIGNNAFIGMSTVILNGAQIGEGSIIGACSLVTQGKEIPPNVLAMGSPAKVIRPVTEEDRQWAKRVNEAYFQRGRYYSEFVKPVEVKPVDRG